ncbi:hypothetical protein NCAS_0A07970 [Naumovozyma castellii]|uniref:Uncharacterized protein n=1 Tax=Naumovozyma castellii TaxID=27288 RepID=G0V7A7_NAUCA|nr:hypothetical protein NCAS_0A07970 [Naumovozyma castellii CBS 4309]CCC67355.1 hypothetical protein NCAS_0A07970 [Naumovozyma castellii CBS 4309]
MDETTVKQEDSVPQTEVKPEERVPQEEVKQEEERGPDLKAINISETIGGTQTRKYLNSEVTPFLLSGMRMIALTKPADPLRVLGEYLIEQSERNKGNK